MVTKRARGFHRFLKTVGSFTEGQVQVTDWDCDQLGWVEIDVKPNGGYYKGGAFKFKVRMTREYPNESPEVACLSDIFHPNIDPTYSDYGEGNNVCVSTLDDWQTGMGLEDVVQGLLFLFHNPNPCDPLSPYFGGFDDTSEAWEEFGGNVLSAMKGGEVEGHTFANCWCEEEEDGTKDDDKVEPHNAVKGGACAVPDETECKNDVDILLTKVNELILKRTEEGKGESDDEMEDEHGRNSDGEDNDDGEDDCNDVDSTVGGTGRPGVSELESDQQVQPELRVQNTEENSNQDEHHVEVQDQEEQSDDTAIVQVEGASSRVIISRQNSKLDRDTDLATSQEPTDEQSNENCDAKDENKFQANGCTNLGDYLQRHKTCSFVAPDFDLSLYTLSVICVYSIFRTFQL